MDPGKRQIKRVHLIHYLQLFKADSNKKIGHLVDITTKGIKMISEEPVPAGKEYSFRLELPALITGRNEIYFSAHSLWCKKDINPDYYLSGFTIREISPNEIETIAALTDSYGFKRT